MLIELVYSDAVVAAHPDVQLPPSCTMAALPPAGILCDVMPPRRPPAVVDGVREPEPIRPQPITLVVATSVMVVPEPAPGTPGQPAAHGRLGLELLEPLPVTS